MAPLTFCGTQGYWHFKVTRQVQAFRSKEKALCSIWHVFGRRPSHPSFTKVAWKGVFLEEEVSQVIYYVRIK